VTLTKATNTGSLYGGASLFAVEWNAPSTP
jgi:hypothetical protein